MGKKVAIISGGASGLGLEIAVKLAQAGRNIIILGRNSEKLRQALARLQAESGYNFADALECNIGREEDVRKTGDYLVRNNLTAEYLYNNAGTGMIADANVTTQAMIEQVFEANLKGMILLTSEILKITPSEEELTIINIMSTSALIGRAGETVYCAAKFGARGYTEALRNELKGTKRNIIAVYPGGMKTDFWNMPGQNRDISSFMDPAEVAARIVNAVTVSDRMVVTDITINRK
jgi:short-subunit dehydrogenase